MDQVTKRKYFLTIFEKIQYKGVGLNTRILYSVLMIHYISDIKGVKSELKS